ncbi:MAG: glycosyltransferase family 2 protein [Chlorobi bacterium]|nr:glycosyltransferase family 2 protein [Chlorobiota bacterium]
MELILLGIYILALVILSIFGLYGLVMVITYLRLKPSDPQPARRVADDELPLVTVQLPIFNERYVVERLIDAVCVLDWPKERLEIQVLDDSTDDTVRLSQIVVNQKLNDGFNIKLLHRTNRAGYKAGALKQGLAVSEGEYVAIFDADFIPSSNFLRDTVPHLIADPNIGMVQARWEHTNGDYSLLTRVQAMALDAHFAMEQQVRNRARVFINFNGTAGVWRKSCIVDAGDWHSDTLTEDLDLSYRAQLRGWRFLYLNDVTVPAELPAEVNGLKLQQFRWTKGAIETAKKHLRRVWKSEQPLAVKLHATIHLTSNVVFPFILFIALLNVPIVLVKKAHPELDPYYNWMAIFILASISTFLFYLCAQRNIRGDWKHRILLFPVFMAGTMGLAVNNTKGVLEALFNKKSEFKRTPKYNITKKEDTWTQSIYRLSKVSLGTMIELLLAIYFVVGVIISVWLVEIAALPFQLLYLFGFGFAGYLSLRHAWARG